MSQIAVIGTGSWGTAVAASLAKNGHTVSMYARRSEVADSINTQHRNPDYLSDYLLPTNLSATCDAKTAIHNTECIIIATPSLYLKDAAQKLARILPTKESDPLPMIGVLTKGFIPDADGSPRFVLDALTDILPEAYKTKLAYIAGPSHAEEVIAEKVTGLVVASQTPMLSIRMREMLRSKRLLVFSSLDVIGVQVCGAVKNVIAIAFGMLDAVATHSQVFGDNASAFLLAAGLNEIQIIGRALGATHPETFTSIAGVGDLDVTCRSRFGRNRRFGRDIILNNVLDNFTGIDMLIENIHKVGYLPEGVPACNYLFKIAQKHNLKIPICLGLYSILNKECRPLDFIESLLSGGKNA